MRKNGRLENRNGPLVLLPCHIGGERERERGNEAVLAIPCQCLSVLNAGMGWAGAFLLLEVGPTI